MEKIIEKKEEENDDDEDSLSIGNLNINQEVDIKENPKKHIVNNKKKNKKSLYDIEENFMEEKNNKYNKCIITYEDIYLGNEMLNSKAKTIPNDFEKNNKYIKNFILRYSKKDIINNMRWCISNFSDSSRNTNSNSTNGVGNDGICEEEEFDDEEIGVLRNNSYDYLDKKGENSHLNDYLGTINNYRKGSNENVVFEEDVIYIDEDEKDNKNIYYIENDTQLKNLNYYNKRNRCNISYISINLFIKKLCTENIKVKYPILYKSFVNLYQEFLSLPSFIEKLINAFNYYYKQMNIEIPDLICLLNKIISTQFKKIENNDALIEKLKNVYKEIEDTSWIDDSLQKEIENVNFVLSSNTTDDFDLDYTKYLIQDRKKTKAISIKSKPKLNKLKNNKLYKYPYFYILDYTDEEIARNLTLISYKMMTSIDFNELWNNHFSKDDKYLKAPNVMKLIDRFEKLMLFIIEDICCYDTNKVRAKLITKWANIAKKCKDFHNYNDLLIINQCFNHYLLKKMIAAWKKLPKSTLNLIEELNKFCCNQQCYINIRKEIVGCKHIAYIPYLGILLKEIVDIENKYKYMEKYGEYNCINCIKMQQLYCTVNKFFEFKNYSFTFTKINELNILEQINPRTNEEIEFIINENEKNDSTLKELIQTGKIRRKTKSDDLFYC